VRGNKEQEKVKYSGPISVADWFDYRGVALVTGNHAVELFQIVNLC